MASRRATESPARVRPGAPQRLRQRSPPLPATRSRGPRSGSHPGGRPKREDSRRGSPGYRRSRPARSAKPRPEGWPVSPRRPTRRLRPTTRESRPVPSAGGHGRAAPTTRPAPRLPRTRAGSPERRASRDRAPGESGKADASAPHRAGGRPRAPEAERNARINAARQAASGKPINATYPQAPAAAPSLDPRALAPARRSAARRSPAITPTWKPEMASRWASPVRANVSRSSGSNPSRRASVSAATIGARAP
jgi:hypothetical protein